MSVRSSYQDQRAASLRDRILAERHRRMVNSAPRRPRPDFGIRLPLDRSRLPIIGRARRPTLGRS